MRVRALALVVLALLLAPLGAPLTRAASDVLVSTTFVARPDLDAYTTLLNWANASDSTNSLNLTWNPFYDQNPDLRGITITPVIPPLAIRETTSRVQTVQRIRFTNQDVLNGVSVSWWRLPIGNVSPSDTINFQIWRADTSSQNVSSIDDYRPHFVETSLASQVWNWSGSDDGSSPWDTRNLTIAYTPVGPLVWRNLSATLTDALVVEGDPNTNYGAFPSEQITQSNPIGARVRSYVDFDVSSIPVYERIALANLSLFEFEVDNADGTDTFALYRSAGAWTDSTITWNTQPGKTSFALDDYTNPATGPFATPNVRLDFNVTAIAQEAHLSGFTNGIEIQYVDELGGSELSAFRSRDWITPGELPYLWVASQVAVSYNFTYVAARAAIFPNVDYFVYSSVSSGAPKDFSLYYTSGDMGNDDRLGSFVRESSTTTFIPVDLDESVLMTRGMANGIAGAALGCATYTDIALCNSDSWVWYNRSFPNVVVSGAPPYTYANLVMPIVTENVSTSIAAYVRPKVYWQEGGSTDHATFSAYWNMTRSFNVFSWNLSGTPADIGKHVSKVEYRWEVFKNDSFFYVAANANDEWTNVSINTTNSGNRTIEYRFSVFGYFNVDTFFFENTNRTIVLIPVEAPEGDLAKLELFERWESNLHRATDNECNLTTTFTNLALTIGSTPITTLLLDHDCIVQGVLNGLSWIASSAYSTLATYFSPATDWLIAIGNWIWTILEFVVRAIEWFLFWAVKFINIFIVATVFAIVFLSPNYVAKGFYRWVRSDFDEGEMRATFREGWERVWSIIQLILSLVLIAISAISAVLPL